YAYASAPSPIKVYSTLRSDLAIVFGLPYLRTISTNKLTMPFLRMTMLSAFYVAIPKLWCSGAYFVGLMLISLYSALLNSYLWSVVLLATSRVSEATAEMEEKAEELGLDTSQMLPVHQAGCKYDS
ncbi:hypothetical protein Vafri_11549, partial [Volvox africanus]